MIVDSLDENIKKGAAQKVEKQTSSPIQNFSPLSSIPLMARQISEMKERHSSWLYRFNYNPVLEYK